MRRYYYSVLSRVKQIPWFCQELWETVVFMFSFSAAMWKDDPARWVKLFQYIGTTTTTEEIQVLLAGGQYKTVLTYSHADISKSLQCTGPKAMHTILPQVRWLVEAHGIELPSTISMHELVSAGKRPPYFLVFPRTVLKICWLKLFKK
jgi:hypothetical protein